MRAGFFLHYWEQHNSKGYEWISMKMLTMGQGTGDSNLVMFRIPEEPCLNHPKSQQRLYKNLTVINIFVTVNRLIMLQL